MENISICIYNETVSYQVVHQCKKKLYTHSHSVQYIMCDILSKSLIWIQKIYDNAELLDKTDHFQFRFAKNNIILLSNTFDLYIILKWVFFCDTRVKTISKFWTQIVKSTMYVRYRYWNIIIRSYIIYIYIYIYIYVMCHIQYKECMYY